MDIDAVSIITVIVCAAGIWFMVKYTLGNGHKWGLIWPMVTLLAHIIVNVILRCVFYDQIAASQELRLFFNAWAGAIKLHTAAAITFEGWHKWKH